MPNNINAASRVWMLLNNTRGYQSDKGAFSSWCKLFSVNGPDQNYNYISVANKLGLVYEELQSIREHLKESNFNEEIFAPTFRKLESAISPQILHAKWGNVSQHLTDDVFTSLGYCSQILPNEEIEISEGDFADISELINELEQLLATDTIPKSLTKLIERHIAVIREAMANYTILGASALKQAVSNALGEIVVESDAFEENKDSPAVKKYGRLWKKVSLVADGALKAEKLVLLGTRVVKALEQIL